ncbi:MAG: hypothetical protein WBB45_00015 [Cyclobacteriaceae bacterium]
MELEQKINDKPACSYGQEADYENEKPRVCIENIKGGYKGTRKQGKGGQNEYKVNDNEKYDGRDSLSGFSLQRILG